MDQVTQEQEQDQQVLLAVLHLLQELVTVVHLVQ
jgi:hypothetical protein